MHATVLLFTALIFSTEASEAASSRPTTSPASQITMIFWEEQSWKPGGGSERLTLWASGRSEITLKRWGETQKTNPGWSATKVGHFSYYRKADPFPPAVAVAKFHAAISAGIEQLKSFPPGFADGGGTLVGIESDGKLKETVIPFFIHPDQPDNENSENHRRYLAVEKVLGDFDTDAVARQQKGAGS